MRKKVSALTAGQGAAVVILVVLFVLVVAALVYGALTGLIFAVWNYGVAPAFGQKAITWTQAFVITLVLWVISLFTRSSVSSKSE